MCGRFVSSSSPERIAAYFGAESAVETLGDNFNVAPTNDIYGIVGDPDGHLELQVFHWGLVPIWAKERKIGQRMINARAETLAEKAAFKGVFKKYRCIIPMDGFYEWAPGTEGGPVTKAGKLAKRPHFIHRTDGEPLAVAGLWSAWRDKSEGPDAPWLHSATVVTTGANATMDTDPRPHAGHPAQGDVAHVARPDESEHRRAGEATGTGTRRPADDARGLDRGQQRAQQGPGADRPHQTGDSARGIHRIRRLARHHSPSSVDERLVHELLQLRPDRVGARRQELGQEHDCDLLVWVAPERRAGGTAPGELAGRRQHPVLHGSSCTENPRPKPTPSNDVSANSGRPNSSRSAPPGRWFCTM